MNLLLLLVRVLELEFEQEIGPLSDYLASKIEADGL